MTYNFDPDRWYNNEIAYLKNELKQGILSEKDFQAAVAEIEKRYDQMCRRLDGTYQINHRSLSNK